MPKPARTVKPTRPASGGRPNSTAPGRAGEADMRQRMAGESLAAQHEKEADRPRENRDDAGGREGGAHEIIVKHGRRRDRAGVRDAP